MSAIPEGWRAVAASHLVECIHCGVREPIEQAAPLHPKFCKPRPGIAPIDIGPSVVTDDQLRAEVTRRILAAGFRVSVSASRFTAQELQQEAEARGVRAWFSDDQLRAECERRFGDEYGARDERWDKLVNAWRRRAEAAEAELKTVRNAHQLTRDSTIQMPPPDGDRVTINGVTFRVTRRSSVPADETDPVGIARLSERDTSLDIDPLDLLCDDA